MATYGAFQTTRLLGAAGPIRVSQAKRAAGGGADRYVVKSFEVPESTSSWFTGAAADVARARCRAAIERQASLASVGGMAAVQAFDVTGDRPFVALDIYPLSAQSAIARRVVVGHDALLHIVRSVVRTLAAIRGAASHRSTSSTALPATLRTLATIRGTPASPATHGNLKLANVFFAGRGPLRRRQVLLSDPCDDAHGKTEAAELADVGRLIESLVNTRDAWSSDDFALMWNDRWERLGPAAGRHWLAICEALRAGASGSAPTINTLDDLGNALRVFGSPTVRRLKRVAIAAAAVTAVGGAAWVGVRYREFTAASTTIRDVAAQSYGLNIDYERLLRDLLASAVPEATNAVAGKATSAAADPLTTVRRAMGARVYAIRPDLLHRLADDEQPRHIGFLHDATGVIATAEAITLLKSAGSESRDGWWPANVNLADAQEKFSGNTTVLPALEQVANGLPYRASVDAALAWRAAFDRLAKARADGLPIKLNDLAYDAFAGDLSSRLMQAEEARVANLQVSIEDQRKWVRDVARQPLLLPGVASRVEQSIAAAAGDVEVLTKQRHAVDELKAASAHLNDRWEGIKPADSGLEKLLRTALEGELTAIIGTATPTTEETSRLANGIDAIASNDHWGGVTDLSASFFNIDPKYRATALTEAYDVAQGGARLAMVPKWKSIFDDYAPGDFTEALSRVERDLNEASHASTDSSNAGDAQLKSAKTALDEIMANLLPIRRNRPAFERLLKTANDSVAAATGAIDDAKNRAALEAAKTDADRKTLAASQRETAAKLARQKRIEEFQDRYAKDEILAPVVKDAVAALATESDDAALIRRLTAAAAYFDGLQGLPAKLDVGASQFAPPFEAKFAAERRAWVADRARPDGNLADVTRDYAAFQKDWSTKVRRTLDRSHAIAAALKDGRGLDDPLPDDAKNTVATAADALRAEWNGKAVTFDEFDADVALLRRWADAAGADVATASATSGLPSQGAMIAFRKLLAMPSGPQALLAKDNLANAVALLDRCGRTPFGRTAAPGLLSELLTGISKDDGAAWRRVGEMDAGLRGAGLSLPPEATFNAALASAREKLAANPDAAEAPDLSDQLDQMRRTAQAVGPDAVNTLNALASQRGNAKLPPVVTPGKDNKATWKLDDKVTLEFRKLKTGRFVSTTEVPVAILNVLYGDGRDSDWYKNYHLNTVADFNRSNTWGPTTWYIAKQSSKSTRPEFANSQAVFPWTNTDAAIYTSKYRPDVGTLGGGTLVPLNLLNLEACRTIAAHFQMELPTTGDWSEMETVAQAAVGQHPRRDFNLRDATCQRRIFQIEAYKKEAEGVSGVEPLFDCSYDQRDVRNPTFEKSDDNTLYFWDVTKGVEDANGFKNVFGNVAEYVTDGPDAYIVGGSALSPPADLAAGLPREKAEVRKTDRFGNRYRADVGFRLAFAGGGSISAKQLSDALGKLAYAQIKPK